MKKPTMKEVLELVEFDRHRDGELFVVNVKGFVWGDVRGNVKGNVWGSVEGDVRGTVEGTVWGDVRGNIEGSVKGDVVGHVGGSVCGTINGRRWQFIETPKEKAIRLIREGRGEEAIKLMKESE